MNCRSIDDRSIFIGDSLLDIGAARGVGIWAYGVRTGHGCRDRERYERDHGVAPVPDLMFESVSEAVDFELEYETLAAPIVSRIRELATKSGRQLVIGVCGRSRAGKTVVAHAIARVLREGGLPCLHVRLDNWIMPAQDRTPDCSAEARNRVDVLRDVVQSLRAGTRVTAPGYDPATRSTAGALTYDPAGQSVIVLDGSFAGNDSFREMIDFLIFTEAPLNLQRRRFEGFYRWKGLDEDAVAVLWKARQADEWAADRCPACDRGFCCAHV